MTVDKRRQILLPPYPLDFTLFPMIKQTILCVDDENDNLDALERIFRSKYRVLRSTSGEEALNLLDQNPGQVSVIITDQRMPEMTGVQFLEKSILKHKDCIRILLTGYTDMESIVSAINSGQIYRYLNKPWDPVDLLNTVDKAAERFIIGRELVEKNQALAKALTDLQVLDQAKNQFMMLINHELKTPLTSILSFTDLLKESNLDSDQTLYVDRVSKGALRLRELVDDVLLIVSAEMKTLKTKIQPFEISPQQIPLNANLQKLISTKNQNLKFQLLDKKIIGDSMYVGQILSRLIHNAVKFSPEKADISVSCELVQPHRVRFKIYNPGSSINNKMMEKVLKPFFIDEEMLNHTTGTGLGLTICQAILRNMSSTLFIDNQAAGVEVGFELPCL